MTILMFSQEPVEEDCCLHALYLDLVTVDVCIWVSYCGFFCYQKDIAELAAVVLMSLTAVTGKEGVLCTSRDYHHFLPQSSSVL